MTDLRKAAQELLDSWDKPFEFPPASTRFENLRAALAQPERKPLTEEEIDLVCAPLGFAQMIPREVARAIERAHGIGGEE